MVKSWVYIRTPRLDVDNGHPRHRRLYVCNFANKTVYVIGNAASSYRPSLDICMI